MELYQTYSKIAEKHKKELESNIKSLGIALNLDKEKIKQKASNDAQIGLGVFSISIFLLITYILGFSKYWGYAIFWFIVYFVAFFWTISEALSSIIEKGIILKSERIAKPFQNILKENIEKEYSIIKIQVETAYQEKIYDWRTNYSQSLERWMLEQENRILFIGESKNIQNRIVSLNPTEFEEFISDMYSFLGYSSQRMGGKNDGGIDIIAQKDSITYFIQCKHYKGTSIGPSFIRELVGAVMMKSQVSGRSQLLKAVFVTSFGVFSQKAREDAHAHNVHIIEINEIEKMIKKSEILSKSNRWASRFGLTQ
jgi:hypothetical protein